MYLSQIKNKIIASPMNPLSTVEFAHACSKAGFWPSLTLFAYNNLIDMQKAIDDSPEGTIISASHDLFSISFKNLKIVEFISSPGCDIDLCKSIMKRLKDNNIEIIYKCVRLSTQGKHLIPYADCIELKTPDGAGFTNDDMPIDEQIDIVTNEFKKPYIIGGGISTYKHVKNWFDRGAYAVYVGTIISASQESIMSKNAKLLLTKAKSKHLSKFKTHQQGIIISEIKEDDFNHSMSSKIGIKTGTKGHIYSGKGIDDINEILPLSEIYANLTQENHNV